MILDCLQYIQAVPGVKPVDFAKLEHLVTFYSQPNQGLPCELCQPVAPQECNSIADDETGKSYNNYWFLDT